MDGRTACGGEGLNSPVLKKKTVKLGKLGGWRLATIQSEIVSFILSEDIIHEPSNHNSWRRLTSIHLDAL